MVRDGYKNTEVGVIPLDWEVVEIGDVTSVTTGDKDTQNKVKGGKYPFYVRSQTVERINSYSFDGEGVLTAGDGVGTGKIFHYVNGKIDYHQRVYLLYDFGHGLDGKYFFFQFSDKFYNRIMQMTAKSSVDSVRKEMITKMLFPLPPTRTEQTAIATALSDADALLSALDGLVAKKEAFKRGMMEGLLSGEIRLEGFEESEHLETLKGWRIISFKDLGKTYGGLTGKSKKDFGHGDAKYVPFMNVIYNTVIDPNFLEVVNVSSKENQNLIVEGDLLFNTSSETPEEVGMCALMAQGINGLYLNSFCFGFRLNQDADHDPLYISYLVNSTIGREAFSLHAQGATRYNLSKKNFANIKFSYPPLPEQHAIATLLSDLDAELSALRARRVKLGLVKDGMMEVLLSGAVRLV